MPLTFIGPNRAVDLSMPEYRHLRPCSPPAQPKPTAAAGGKPAASQPKQATRKAPAPAWKRLPPPPSLAPVAAAYLPLPAARQEAFAIADWLDTERRTPGRLSDEQRAAKARLEARRGEHRHVFW